jgi:hypothetical protein
LFRNGIAKYREAHDRRAEKNHSAGTKLAERIP